MTLGLKERAGYKLVRVPLALANGRLTFRGAV